MPDLNYMPGCGTVLFITGKCTVQEMMNEKCYYVTFNVRAIEKTFTNKKKTLLPE